MNILITGGTHFSTAERALFEQFGSVCYEPNENSAFSSPSLKCEIAIGNNVFHSNPLSSFSNLHFLFLTSVGLERIDIANCSSRKITITNAAGIYSQSIAEYVLFQILCVYKNINKLTEFRANKTWDKWRDNKNIFGKNVCFLGFGSIAHHVCNLLSPFQCAVSYFDKIDYKEKNYRYFQKEKIKEEIRKADIIISSLPDLGPNNILIGKEEIDSIQQASIFINVGRSRSIDDSYLCEASLERNFFICSDVFKNEPLPIDSPYWGNANAFISPHISFCTQDSHKAMLAFALKNCQNACSGKPLNNVVSK